MVILKKSCVGSSVIDWNTNSVRFDDKCIVGDSYRVSWDAERAFLMKSRLYLYGI